MSTFMFAASIVYAIATLFGATVTVWDHRKRRRYLNDLRAINREHDEHERAMLDAILGGAR